jgi:hypothetical protein
MSREVRFGFGFVKRVARSRVTVNSGLYLGRLRPRPVRRRAPIHASRSSTHARVHRTAAYNCHHLRHRWYILDFSGVVSSSLCMSTIHNPHVATRRVAGCRAFSADRLSPGSHEYRASWRPPSPRCVVNDRRASRGENSVYKFGQHSAKDMSVVMQRLWDTQCPKEAGVLLIIGTVAVA